MKLKKQIYLAIWGNLFVSMCLVNSILFYTTPRPRTLRHYHFDYKLLIKKFNIYNLNDKFHDSQTSLSDMNECDPRGYSRIIPGRIAALAFPDARCFRVPYQKRDWPSNLIDARNETLDRSFFTFALGGCCHRILRNVR
jgi:hypothetical protein